MEDAQKLLEEARDTVVSSIDEGIRTLSSSLASGTAMVKQEAGKLRESAQELTNTVEQEATNAEQVAFSYLKEGVRLASENETAAVAAGAMLLLVAVPGIRQFFVRRTVGKFRSEEGRFRAAELKAQQLQESAAQQADAVKMLEERLSAAQVEYDTGLQKLRATGQRMLALTKDLKGAQRDAKGIISELRRIPSQQALQLRSEVASKAAELKQQQSLVDRHINRLLKQGMV